MAVPRLARTKEHGQHGRSPTGQGLMRPNRSCRLLLCEVFVVTVYHSTCVSDSPVALPLTVIRQ